MAETIQPIHGVFDVASGNLLAIGAGGQSTTSVASMGGSARLTTLSSGTYTLSAADADTVFIAMVNVVVTVPTLATMPNCLFVPRAGASVTLHPTGGTTINGATSDIVRSVITDPIGFNLVPNYGGTNSYGTTAGIVSFGNIGGLWSENLDLLAAMNLKASTASVLLNSQMNGTQKMTGNFTATAADIGKLFWADGTTSRNLTIPAGLPSNFWCKIAKLNANTGNITVVAGSGVTIHSKGGALRLTGENVSAVIRGLDDPTNNPNRYYIDGVDMVV